MNCAKKLIIWGMIFSSIMMLSGCKADNKQEESSVSKIETDFVETNTSSLLTTNSSNMSVSTVKNDSGTEGGNNDNYTEIGITISENRYYYDNAEISIEDLIEIFDNLDKNDVVNLHDDYASDKSFENLTSILEEREIPYITD